MKVFSVHLWGEECDSTNPGYPCMLGVFSSLNLAVSIATDYIFDKQNFDHEIENRINPYARSWCQIFEVELDVRQTSLTVYTYVVDYTTMTLRQN